MMIDLTDTQSSKINQALVDARRGIGSPTLGMVLTLVIVTDEANQYDAMKAATSAAHEHPSRILVVIGRPGADIRPRLDAEVRVGDSGVGETVVLRLHGELAEHAESVVLPLLLPDAPTVVWWPGRAPEVPSADPLGALAARRITDAAAAPRRPDVLRVRASAYTPGDTDLAWTRATPWRSLLAAALDQRYQGLSAATVEAKAGNPTAELLALWLADRLDLPVRRVVSEGPGVTAVQLDTDNGPITVNRPDGVLATLSSPGQPDRHVALKRREAAELMAEELRRLDPDDVYAATLARAALEAALSAGHPAGTVTSTLDPVEYQPSVEDSHDGHVSDRGNADTTGSGAAATPAREPAGGARRATSTPSARTPDRSKSGGTAKDRARDGTPRRRARSTGPGISAGGGESATRGAGTPPGPADGDHANGVGS